MKFLHIIPLLLVIILSLSGFTLLKPNREVLYQTSTIDALLAGVYDGEMTFKELKKYGDFGIGTLNGVDGEMICLDGKFVQITADGVAHPVDESQKTPFAAMTFFDRDQTTFIDKEMTLAEVEAYLDGVLPSKNLFYAVKIEGTFTLIKTRSVPKQYRPYKRLAEVVKDQPTFELRDVQGTIVGFRCPAYAKGVNVPGYHFHFINAECTAGGHVLDARMRNVSVTLDATAEFHLELPNTPDFRQTSLEGDQSAELEKVEK